MGRKDIFNNDQLECCKHCGSKLKRTDIRKLPVKDLPARYGVYWMGIEYPYLQIYKISCSNLGCQKTYSCKQKKSRWFYK